MNLSELKKKHAEMGKEIERLEKASAPLTFADLKIGDRFREPDAWYHDWQQIKASDDRTAYKNAEGSLWLDKMTGAEKVIRIDATGRDLPPEKQVKK